MDELLEDTLIDQLDTLHEQYVSMKMGLFDGGGDQLPPSLALVQTSLTDYVKSAVNDCEDKLERRFGKTAKRMAEPNTADGAPPKKLNIKDRRSEIRERAYNEVTTQGRFQKRKPSKQSNHHPKRK